MLMFMYIKNLNLKQVVCCRNLRTEFTQVVWFILRWHIKLNRFTKYRFFGISDAFCVKYSNDPALPPSWIRSPL